MQTLILIGTVLSVGISVALLSVALKIEAYLKSIAKEALRKEPVPPKTVYGFGPVTVPPGKTVSVTVKPFQRFRGEKLINTADTKGLYLTNLSVARKPQFDWDTEECPIAVATYSGTVLDNEILMTVCEPDEPIQFKILNTGDEPATWAASLLGYRLPEDPASQTTTGAK